MIEISLPRAGWHGLGINLQSVWSSLQPTVEPAAESEAGSIVKNILGPGSSPTPSTTPATTPAFTPSPSGGGMSTGLLMIAGVLALGAGGLVWYLSKEK